MKNMLETLAERIARANAQRPVSDPIEPRAHISMKPWRRGDDDEQMHDVVIEDIGSDFIQVKRHLIDRKTILQIQPINF